MLPLKATSSLCLSSSDFLAVMGTAVVITAAATYWCTRQFSRKLKLNVKTFKIPSEMTKTSPTSSTSIPADLSDDLSYLCTGCATETYTPQQLSSISTTLNKSSPYKMVVLVRTDLNMVS